MASFKKLNNILGWAIFLIALLTYALTAEPTGSLWDCGEFISGAYKLEVVHPPGAPFFILIGRMFAGAADMLSSNPENIAWAVNLLSGVCTALAVLFVTWITTILGRMMLVGRSGVPSKADTVAILGAGAVAGLSSTFITSMWFSAVEGEVYAMSTFFTALTFWIMMKWYNQPASNQNDRYIVLAAFCVGLSIGVHLLSLLTIPAIAILYYFKKNEKVNILGLGVAFVAGIAALWLVQSVTIIKLPNWGALMDKFFVNDIGLPVGSGFMFFYALIIAGLIGGLIYASRKASQAMQTGFLSFLMVLVGFSLYTTILIRANAGTPINMNEPKDLFSLVSYLSREQYGERDILYGPTFEANPINVEYSDKYGLVDGKYIKVDQKGKYIYKDEDKMLFPRMIQTDRRPNYRQFLGAPANKKMKNVTMGDNLKFLFKYQMGWMYWRYFMWNFAGRQNGTQGTDNYNPKFGNWISGVGFIDNARLFNMKKMPDYMKNHKAANKYYFLPIIFGLLGLFFHFRKRPKEWFVILILFLMTGLAITFYSNQPHSEPRERDYVLVGSFFTFCMWIGLAVLAIYSMLKERVSSMGAAGIGVGLTMIVPLILGFQNWDDHNRGDHFGARDYAINFLESCDKNAIIFTHGDNDTYPLWYAQEVENIRPDIRVINLSLIAVDWYINQMRRKVNDSPAIKLSISQEAYRGRDRNQLMFYDPNQSGKTMNLVQGLKFMGGDNPLPLQGGGKTVSYMPAKKFVLPVNKQQVLASGTVKPEDADKIVDYLPIKLSSDVLYKDRLAMLDIIASNSFERPIYWAVTSQTEKLLGLQHYMRLEGLALRLVPINSQTERDSEFGVLGYGSVGTDVMYENIMTKFAWGNFNTDEDEFINYSYGPSVQTLKIAFLRLGRKLIAKGEWNKVVDITNKYFEVFPNNNFTYDFNSLYMLRYYFQAKDYCAQTGAETGIQTPTWCSTLQETIKPHIQALAKNTAQQKEFYASLSTSDIKHFSFDKNQADATQQELLQTVNRYYTGDQEFQNEINALFSSSTSQPIQN